MSKKPEAALSRRQPTDHERKRGLLLQGLAEKYLSAPDRWKSADPDCTDCRGLGFIATTRDGCIGVHPCHCRKPHDPPYTGYDGKQKAGGE